MSHVISGLKSTAAVLREVNDVNRGLQYSRAFLVHDRLAVEGVLPVEGLTPVDLRDLCLEVGGVADEVGQLMSAVHGGQLVGARMTGTQEPGS